MPKKRYSETLEHLGIKVTIFEKAGTANFWYNITSDGERVRGSLKTRNKKLARVNARAVAESIVRSRLNGDQIGSPTLGQVFDLYFEKRAPQLAPRRRPENETRRSLFLKAWGESKRVDDICQTDVDEFSALRRSGKLAPPGGKTAGVRDGSIAADFRWLSSVFNWAHKHKVNGRRLLLENPLPELERPSEANPYRPTASHKRYLATMAKADMVDPMGRLKCALSLARHAGRREGAISRLRVSDVLREVEQVRAVLASEGLDENDADKWPLGAIHWRPEDDKQGFGNLSPMTPEVRSALDEYLPDHLQELDPRAGDAWLFPSPLDPTKPIRIDTLGRWLMRAEKLAEVPKLKYGRWHPYRRLWATERKHLPDVDVAAAGGWRDTEALRESYQQADADTMLDVMSAGNGV